MKVLGITGGVGAGKSTVLNYLTEKYGVTVIQLDQVAHLLMRPGEKCYEEIVAAFGEEILNEAGEIDRRILGSKTFGSVSEMDKLNRIVHPSVKEYIIEQIRSQEDNKDEVKPFLVIEAALLLEDHYDEICDEIWYIYVDYDTRVKRLIQSRGYTKEKVDAILKNQKTDEEFRSRCQFIIDNTSEIMENTYEQIDRGLTEHGFL